MGFKLLKTAKTRQKPENGHFRGIFGKNTPFLDPKAAFFDIVLVSLVGVGIYEKILRPTQNPTLAGMDPYLQGVIKYAHITYDGRIRNIPSEDTLF